MKTCHPRPHHPTTPRASNIPNKERGGTPQNTISLNKPSHTIATSLEIQSPSTRYNATHTLFTKKWASKALHAPCHVNTTMKKPLAC